jgi:hypothetical protein
MVFFDTELADRSNQLYPFGFLQISSFLRFVEDFGRKFGNLSEECLREKIQKAKHKVEILLLREK